MVFNKEVAKEPKFLMFIEKTLKLKELGHFEKNLSDKNYFGKFLFIFQEPNIKDINEYFGEPFENILIDLNKELDNIIREVA